MDAVAAHNRLGAANRDFIARGHKLPIGGEWVEAASGQTFAVFDPSNGQPIAQVAEGRPEDVDRAARAVCAAFEEGPWPRMKPTEQTPFSAIRLGGLISEAGFPPGVFNLITGHGTPGAAIAAHPDVDKVAFIGSTEVGKLIVQAAAGNLKKGSLELSDKSPAIGFPDADLSVAIPGVAIGIFFNMGQCCTAGSRLFVQEKIFDKMMTGLADQAAKPKVGPGLDPETGMGPLVSDEQFRRVSGYLESGRQQGAEVVTGGKRHGNEGYFIAPTILSRTPPETKVVREESFGPVVCALPYDDDDLDRIARQGNATEYGLAASIRTRDIGIARKLARKLKLGSVRINIHNFNDVALPFGGYKQSGRGREMGYEAIELYTETKTVAALL